MAVFSAWLLSGCAVPMALEELDITAKEFKVPADGKAGIYIYRNETIGYVYTMQVFVDDYLIGSTGAKTYHYIELVPGYHVFKGSSENDSVLDVKVVANKLYYIWQEVKFGLITSRNKLHLMDESQGQKGVLESKRAVSTPIPEQ
jgi:hypothetical protein